MIGKILKNPITILVSVVLGIIFGFYEKNLALSLGIIGDVYLNLFQMTVIPILVTSIIVSLAMLMQDKNARQHVTKILLVFLIVLLVTATFGTVIGTLARPGKDLGETTTPVLDKIIKSSVDTSRDEMALYSPELDANSNTTSLVDFFANIVPSNIFSSFSNGIILQLVFFSILFGIAIGFLTDSSSHLLIRGVSSLKESFQKLINWTMYALPLGLVFLMGKQIAQVGVEILLAMVKFIVVFYIAGFIALTVCSLIIWVKSGIKNPIKVMKAMMDPIIICFATRNSFASLPSSVNALKSLNFDHNTVDLVFPLGVTVLRFGNIMYFALASCFVSQIYDAPVTFTSLLLMVVGSLLAGTATAGASGLLTLPMISLILDPLGLPVESILVVFMAIDSLIDPMRTLLIVYVNIATTALVAGRENGSITFKAANPTSDKPKIQSAVSKDKDAEGEKKNLTLLFSDIENFTGISERENPDILLPSLKSYFSDFTSAIKNNSGSVEKYIGSSVMAFWGEKSGMSEKNQALFACRSALECKDICYRLSETRVRNGGHKFRGRFAVHTGEAVLGKMALNDGFEHVVFGRNVNLVTQLKGLNKLYGTEIILSSATQELIKDHFETRLLDKIRLGKKSQGFCIYELLCEKGKANPKTLKLYRLYEQGLKYYFIEDWENCIKSMSAVIEQSNDVAARVIKERAEKFKISPPRNWTGVYEC